MRKIISIITHPIIDLIGVVMLPFSKKTKELKALMSMEVPTMAKYTQDVKDQAVEAAKEGTSLTQIQRDLGPNPKATQRYLKKAGIDYNDLKKELKESGKLQAATKKNGEKTEGVPDAVAEVLDEDVEEETTEE